MNYGSSESGFRFTVHMENSLRKLIHSADGEKGTVIHSRVSIPEAKLKAPLIHWGKNKTLHA
jgi:hypothetical protein